MRIGISVQRSAMTVALLLALAASAGAVDAAALADLRAESLRRAHDVAAAAPIDDVAWAPNMTISVEGIDLAAGTIVARMGKSRMQLPIRTIDDRQLAHLMAAAATGSAKPDIDVCVLAAALLRLQNEDERAREVLERAKLRAAGVDDKFAAWAERLGLETPAQRAERVKGDDDAKAKDKADKVEEAKTASAPAAKTVPGAATKHHAIAKEHPRLFGSRARLQALVAERPLAWAEVLETAKKPLADAMELTVPTWSLVYAVTGDQALGRKAIEQCLPLIHGPIKVGHIPFGTDLAMCAFAYDLCHDLWSADEKAAFIEYFDKTYAQNVDSEVSVSANGWYQYKWWGIGLASYATMYEDASAPQYLSALQADYTTRAAPMLELMGDGGGWAEGFYIHYWLGRWLCFCESARLCEGWDPYVNAPKFYANRALCSLFDQYPGTAPSELNRGAPHGDGSYGEYGGFSQFDLAARRILCNYYRNDPVHQAVESYNARILDSIPEYGWWTFLFDDPAMPRGDYAKLDLSHFAPGSGDVFARSSWDGDATWLSFRCGDRFNGHQHLDVGHFMLFRKQPLLGDAGVYDDFGGDHAANYYTRTIAHNSVLIFDPAEKFAAQMRGYGGAIANDGGQQFPWTPTPAGHNGGLPDVASWQANKALMDTGDMAAFADEHAYVYAAGDCTKAYWPGKCQTFTRQLVFLRPSTVVVFDRVRSQRADQKKYWIANLHAAPAAVANPLVSTNGDGRVFIQTLLPEQPEVDLVTGDAMYAYFGQGAHPPAKAAPAPVPTSRVEISDRKPSETTLFLHVLTTTDAKTESVPSYVAKVKGNEVTLTVGPAAIAFSASAIGGSITINGQKHALTPNLKP